MAKSQSKYIVKTVRNWKLNNGKPMDYKTFKLSLELSHYDTFEKDEWCAELYKEYVNGKDN